MAVEIKVYSSMGDGLKNNPHLEDIFKTIVVCGVSTDLHKNLNIGRQIAEKNARTEFLFGAHVNCVDFLTNLGQDKSELTISSQNKKQTYFCCTCSEFAIGYIGTFRNPSEEKERRIQQIVIARQLISELGDYNQKSRLKFYEQTEKALARLG